MVLGVFIFFVGGGCLIGLMLYEIGKLFFPKRNNYDYSKPSKTTIINKNYYQKTENHLHISKKDLEQLNSKS